MKSSAFSLFTALLFSVTLLSCKKEDKVAQLDMKKVSYGSDTAQNMDIYLPSGRNADDTKVLLFIHGGSWSGGDKSEFDDAITAIRSNLPDYAFFNINYRLANNGKNRFPAQMEDVQSAISQIQNKAIEYQINPNKIGLIGASAGAHLALLHAYKNNADGKIKAVVDLFGPTDLVNLYNNHPIPAASRPVLVNFLGATPATNPNLYAQSSPINFITAQSVPTRIFHGTSDFVVPIAQSNALKAKLESNNVKVEMTAYTNEGHGWFGNVLTDTYNKAVQFIKENVK